MQIMKCAVGSVLAFLLRSNAGLRVQKRQEEQQAIRNLCSATTERNNNCIERQSWLF